MQIFDLLIIATIGFFIGLYGILYGFKSYRQYQYIRDTPTANAQSISIGLVELDGIIKPKDDNVYENPITGDDCVYYEREIEKYNPKDKGSDWDEIHTDNCGAIFYIEDETGKVLVNPDNPETDLKDRSIRQEEYKTNPGKELPKALQGAGLSNTDSTLVPDFLESERYRVTIRSLEPNMNSYVLGRAKPRDIDESYADNEKNIIVSSPKGWNNSLLDKIPGIRTSSPFIISNKSEEDLVKNRKYMAPLGFFVGLLLSSGCLYFILNIILQGSL